MKASNSAYKIFESMKNGLSDTNSIDREKQAISNDSEDFCILFHKRVGVHL
jgi:hypothetical protein